jgi:hypothetical protein
MKKFSSLVLAGLVAGMFSAGTAIAADPKGDDVEQPDEFGPKWAARILFVPVIQSPFHR